MKKKSVNLVTAVGVLVILSGAYVGIKAYVAKQEEKETAESEESESAEIVSISADDIKSIKFLIDKQEVVFEKDGDSWVKADESAFPVSQDKVDALVASLESITATRTLEDVEDASEYELDQPENTITVTTTDGDTTVIQIGMENSSTNQEYIDLNNDPSTVYVVGSSTFQSFEGELYDFAESGTFPAVDSSTVNRISVDGKESSYTVKKDENNMWTVAGSDGKEEKADSAKATSLASALSGMAYASFVNYDCADSDLSKYGLDKPYSTITVDYQEEIQDSSNEEDSAKDDAESVTEASDDGKETLEEVENTDSSAVSETSGESEDEEATEDADTTKVATEMVDRQLVIYIGDQASDGGRYVRIDGSNEIYTISEDSLDSFIGKTNEDFWDMTVSYLSVNNLEKLSVNYKDNDYTIDVSRETSEDEGETDEDDSSSSTVTVTLSYSLDGNEIDSTTFTTYYNKLINMTAQKRLTDEYKSNADPEMTAELTDVDGNVETVQYYSYDTNYYAAVVGEKIYLVNKMSVKEMFTAFDNVIGNEEKDTAENIDSAEITTESEEKKTWRITFYFLFLGIADAKD